MKIRLKACKGTYFGNGPFRKRCHRYIHEISLSGFFIKYIFKITSNCCVFKFLRLSLDGPPVFFLCGRLFLLFLTKPHGSFFLCCRNRIVSVRYSNECWQFTVLVKFNTTRDNHKLGDRSAMYVELHGNCRSKGVASK